MILCVNLNAAIDRMAVIEDFAINAIHRPGQILALPGGKGCNCARILKVLGSEVVVTGWVGGFAGKFIESGLRAEGISTALVHIEPESRTCYSVLDPVRHTLTEVYESSQPVPARARARFERVYRRLLPDCELVLLCGSLPNGLPADTYARLVLMAKSKNVPVFLDSSGEPLRLGLGQPTLLKPNLSELQVLTDRPAQTEPEILTVITRLSQATGTAIVVSRGEAGALAIAGGKIWKAIPPRLDVVSAVGSGDAMLAGIAHGFAHHLSFPDALRLGMAAGAANALQIGAGRADLADILRLQDDVQVSLLN
jgi:tagatose 6-phosphate kinase